ncbi:MAG: hypothetical protein IPJ76_03625 [Flavobacteriales bacterium]|nr:MAG: hypothetical protein IPJ76_03625 [Flavobacteriales bacterium]
MGKWFLQCLGVHALGWLFGTVGVCLWWTGDRSILPEAVILSAIGTGLLEVGAYPLSALLGSLLTIKGTRPVLLEVLLYPSTVLIYWMATPILPAWLPHVVKEEWSGAPILIVAVAHVGAELLRRWIWAK